ncbi:MAG: hypothetical protein V1726_07320 [Methanobacteriota archaeon]
MKNNYRFLTKASIISILVAFLLLPINSLPAGYPINHNEKDSAYLIKNENIRNLETVNRSVQYYIEAKDATETVDVTKIDNIAYITLWSEPPIVHNKLS